MDKQEWRTKRAEAYRNYQYQMSVPAVTTGRWDIIAWCNHVQFYDKELNGFDDRKGG